MKRYEKYSIAANLLTNEIPSHWTMMRNRVFLRPKLVPVGQDANKYPLLSLTTKGIVFRDIESGKGKFPKDFDTYQTVEPNDIVFCLFDVDETPRTVGLSSLNGMLTGAYDTFSMSNVVSPQFINYYYTAVDDVKALRPYYSGLRKVVKKDKFMAISIPLPPIPEQNKIVAYLNKRITLIDNCKCQRERELQTLNELKQAEIASVVTRGLNPDVPMKDSGIPWIGQIPVHWDMKYLFQVAHEHYISNKDIHHQNLLSLSYGKIVHKDINTTEGLLPASFDTYQIIEPGNIVFRFTDLQNDHKSLRVGLSKETGIITSAYIAVEVDTIYILPEYFYYTLHSFDIKKLFYSMGGGLRQSLNYNGIRKLYLPIPPLEEQKAIVSFVDNKIKKIEVMIQSLESEIDRLTEYKQRLISDVVTGQIDVRGEQIQ